MATTTSTKAPVTDEAPVTGTDITQAPAVDITTLQTGTLAALREAFDKERAEHDSQTKAIESAVKARAIAAVWMARIAYRTATHPDVATARYKENITGAARVLGMPVATLRPYALAGIALHAKDRAGLLSAPDAEDLALVEASFDATSRADQKEKRLKEKAKKEALEAKARELDALKQANGDTKAPEAPAPVDGDKAPVAPVQAPVAGKAPVAPVEAPVAPVEAPAGPSLQDDAVTVAKELVRKLKALKAGGDKATILKVNAILADFYPALKA